MSAVKGLTQEEISMYLEMLGFSTEEQLEDYLQALEDDLDNDALEQYTMD